jgi:ATP-dependent DNA helicase RecQ
VALADGTKDAREILAAIHRTGERFGAAHIIDVVQGVETEKVVVAGHNKAAAFGAGAARKKEEWQSLIRQLVASGFVNLGRYGGLSILPKGHALLRGEASFHCRPPASRHVTGRKAARDDDSVAPVTAAQSSLLASLKKIRLRIAKERQVPAYLIFSDRSLLDMAKRCPRNIGEFAAVNGVGSSKLKDFAESFLSAIRAHQDNGRDVTASAERNA